MIGQNDYVSFRSMSFRNSEQYSAMLLPWRSILLTSSVGSVFGTANSLSALAPLNVPSLKAIRFPTVSEKQKKKLSLVVHM